MKLFVTVLVEAMYNNEEIVLNADDLSTVELFVQ